MHIFNDNIGRTNLNLYMLHHVTLHVTLKLPYFTIVLDMLLHVTPTFLKGTIDFFIWSVMKDKIYF